jgi:hypothetical protein
VWNLTINDTSPVFYYCRAPGSCISYGMVGVINPNSSTSITTQITLAKQANYMLQPGESLPGQASSSLASMAASATTETLTVTASSSPTSATPAAQTTHSNSSSGLSGGEIAGIAVGAAAVALLAAGLCFFFGRTKSLKDEIAHHRATTNNPSAMPPPETAALVSPGGPQGRNSDLPPYQQYRQSAQEMKPPTPPDIRQPDDIPSDHSYSPPPQSGNFMPYHQLQRPSWGPGDGRRSGCVTRSHAFLELFTD